MNQEKFNIKEILSFLDHFYKLKEIDRTGWKTKLLLDRPESVADHTLTMIVLVLIFAEYNKYPITKTLKMIKMTLIHDLGESIIGDYMPETIEVEEKKQIETIAIKNIISQIPWTRIKKKYIKIWNEYEENKTYVSKLVHMIDKLEMAFQANYYLKNNKNINKDDLKPFFDSALKYVRENCKVKDNNKKLVVDEIKQILLYLNK
ncbi:MAG: HD domain-containing protein [Thermoproteota archaeon]|nr:HD domain-containing protein [Thermoproteota archaeon]